MQNDKEKIKKAGEQPAASSWLLAADAWLYALCHVYLIFAI